jgi:hypothetical protein
MLDGFIDSKARLDEAIGKTGTENTLMNERPRRQSNSDARSKKTIVRRAAAPASDIC